MYFAFDWHRTRSLCMYVCMHVCMYVNSGCISHVIHASTLHTYIHICTYINIHISTHVTCCWQSGKCMTVAPRCVYGEYLIRTPVYAYVCICMYHICIYVRVYDSSPKMCLRRVLDPYTCVCICMHMYVSYMHLCTCECARTCV